jgi:hypothetical protein
VIRRVPAEELARRRSVASCGQAGRIVGVRMTACLHASRCGRPCPLVMLSGSTRAACADLPGENLWDVWADPARRCPREQW